MRSGRGLILRIDVAKAAQSARSGHALFKAYETAISPAPDRSSAVNRAPRIVLGLSARSNADYTDANSQKEQQEPHSRLLKWPSVINAYARVLFHAHARRGAAHRGEYR